MTTIAPPPPPPQATSPPPTAPPVVIVANPPSALALLAIGSRLEATILSQTGPQLGQGGSLVLADTPLGRLALQTGVSLPKSGVLTLQVQSQGKATQFQLVAIDGRPTGAFRNNAALVEGAGGAGAAPLAATSGPGGVPTVRMGATVVATLLRPAPPGSPTPVAASGTVPGASTTSGATDSLFGMGATASTRGPLFQGLSSSSSSVFQQLLHPGGGSSGPAHAAGGGGLFQAAAPAPAPSSSGQAAPPGLPAGTMANVRIVATQSPPAGGGMNLPGPGSAALVGGQPLTGTVVGNTPSGHPMIQTGAGVFSLATRAPLPAGTTVTLEVVGDPIVPRSAARTGVHAATTAGGMLTERTWPALDEAIRLLQEANPGLAQQFLTTVVPRADSALAASILSFMMAVRGGDVRSWLGEGPTRVLHRLRPNLLDRLEEDFGAMGRLAKDKVVPDWRIALAPFLFNDQLDRIRVLVRRPGEEEGEEEADRERGTRFVVDLDLTRLGHMQLDGLVRARQKRLDLILRTGSPLSREMREDIRTIFRNAAEVTGMAGGVTFQSAPANFVEFSASAVSDEHLGVVV